MHPSINEVGNLDLVCVSDLHLEITFQDLQDFMKDVELVYLGPNIRYTETIRQISPVKNCPFLVINFKDCFCEISK